MKKQNSRVLFSRRLAALMHHADLSQDQLAHRSGVTQTTISLMLRYEAERREFRMETAEIIANTLGYELWQLILPIEDAINPPERDVASFRRLILQINALVHRFALADPMGRQRIEWAAVLESPEEERGIRGGRPRKASAPSKPGVGGNKQSRKARKKGSDE